MYFWNFKALVYKWFRNIFPLSYFLRQENKNIQELLTRIPLKVLEERKVVDIGTGMGNALQLVSKGPSIFGLDKSLKMLYYAAKKTKGKFVAGDALYLPFKNKSFYLLMAVGIFEYQKNGINFLQELFRITEEKGWVIITTSPRTLLTFIRQALGNRIYPIESNEFQDMIQRIGFKMKDKRKTMLQNQYLLLKEHS
ncbi:MAG: class I SAM-dependent methyltransferase [candidate division KSB1 bacterium]|nr:class I SAM-dependent methyltransferase [candidate division KSB1 bacterium]